MDAGGGDEIRPAVARNTGDEAGEVGDTNEPSRAAAMVALTTNMPMTTIAGIQPRLVLVGRPGVMPTFKGARC